jgi:bifunctional non-homologous end joining protein LigD
VILDQAPMLASPHSSIAPSTEQTLAQLVKAGGWNYEVKWDGVRCLAHIADGDVMLTNRNRKDITYRYPEVTEELSVALPTGLWVLDGEIVAFDGDGMPSFDLVARRDRITNLAKVRAQRGKIPVTYLPFDVLYANNQDIRQASYMGRQLHLQARRDELTTEHMRVGPTSQDGETMWQFVCQRGMEGLIAKRHDSIYHGGRSPEWVKLKRMRRDSFIVTGFQPGTGKHEGKVGALLIGAYRGGELVPFGKVGTGFSDGDRENLEAMRVMGPETLIVEVEHVGVTSGNALRFPSFKGIRSDLTPDQCHAP